MTILQANKKNRRRLILSLDSDETARGLLLDTSARLAREMEAELTGLFVRNPALLYAAELPFARALNISTGEWQKYDPEMMEYASNFQAGRLKKLLRATATKHHIAWSFEVLEGVMEEVLRSYAAEEDFLLLRQHPDQDTVFTLVKQETSNKWSQNKVLLDNFGYRLVCISPNFVGSK